MGKGRFGKRQKIHSPLTRYPASFLFALQLDMQIKNSFLSVTATSLGGELTSVQLFGQELLYQKEGTWKFQDHILFPLIGPADRYSCKGQIHSTSRHGFARNSDFFPHQENEEQMSFSLKENTESLRLYPYHFSFVEAFILEEETLLRRYEITNTGDETLPFATGSHPAFYCEFGKAKLTLPEHFLYFTEPLDSSTVKEYPKGGEITLTKDFLLGMDTLILPTPEAPIVLDTGRDIRIEFQYASPYIAIWTPKSDEDAFLCVEPWWGLPQTTKDPDELIDRPFLTRLDPKEKRIVEDRIRFSLL